MSIYGSKFGKTLFDVRFTADDIWEVYGLETNLTDKEIAILIDKIDWREIEEAACRLFWEKSHEQGKNLGFDMEA